MNAEIDAATERDLTQLVMNCPDLRQLETILSQFNIFRVLRAAEHEIRHSNMLAWLLTPDEVHGLGDRFLRSLLMQIVHDAPVEKRALSLPKPIEIDTVDLDFVDVARESDNIDVLLVLTTGTETKWVVCLENKVNSRQHSNQLRRYREIVEARYPTAEHRLFVLLSRDGEEPEDSTYLTCTYETVAQVLTQCVEERAAMMRDEPRMLVSHYLKLLREEFVGESEAAQLARRIYRSHRNAIQFIIENLSDPISEASAAMEEVLRTNQAELDVLLGPSGKGYVRFIPKEWDVPQNSGGTAWGANSRYVSCEVVFWGKTVEFHITVARAPDAWADKVWARMAEPPFKQEWKKRPKEWIKPFKVKSDIPVGALADESLEDVKTRLLEWLREVVSNERFKRAVEAMTKLLEQLERRNDPA